jgi:hypothetical protein
MKVCLLHIDFSEDQLRFMNRLQHVGDNRYFTRQKGMEGLEIHTLDSLVWNIRRYCCDLEIQKESVLKTGQTWTSYNDYLKSFDSHPNAFRLQGGQALLERIISGNKKDPRRTHLVWKNFKYGSRKKGRITFTRHMSGATPPHILWYDDLEDWLLKHVFISNKDMAKAKELARQGGSSGSTSQPASPNSQG